MIKTVKCGFGSFMLYSGEILDEIIWVDLSYAMSLGKRMRQKKGYVYQKYSRNILEKKIQGVHFFYRRIYERTGRRIYC